jgi:hypothetical protein
MREAGMGMWRRAVGFVAVVASIAGGSPAQAVTDLYGYRAIASTEPDGPVVPALNSISATGTRVTFHVAPLFTTPGADDAAAVDLPLTSLNGGAGFPFYGTVRTLAHMTTNGFLGFTKTSAISSVGGQCPLPDTTTPDDGIAVLWNDLVVANPPDATRGGFMQSFTTCPYAQGGAGACVVFEWYRARNFGSGLDQAFSFQAVLYDNGNVLLIYGDGNPDAGASSTTGLDGPGGFLGLSQACDTAASIPANSAILVTAPGDARSGTAEVEPNEDQASAKELPAGVCGIGALPTPDAVDLWRVAGTTPGERMFVYADANGNQTFTDASLELVVGAGDTTIASDENSGYGASPVVAGVPMQIGGDVFVRLTPSSMGTSVGQYVLMALVNDPSDVGVEVDPNDNFLEATPVTAPVMEGTLSEGDIDHYSIDAAVGDVITVMVDNDADRNDENTRTDLVMMGPDLGLIGSGDTPVDKAATAGGRGVVRTAGKQLIRLRRTQTQGDSPYAMAVLRNCAPACADADADGACDALDNCPGATNDQADADGDGTGDACDGCAVDGAKTAAGLCGCGVVDADANANGVVDCLANAELRARLDGLRSAVGALTKTKKKKPNPTADAVRTRLDDVVAYLRSGPAGLVLLSGDANGMADTLSSVVGKALKGGKFGKKKKKAVAAVQSAFDAVGP